MGEHFLKNSVRIEKMFEMYELLRKDETKKQKYSIY